MLCYGTWGEKDASITKTNGKIFLCISANGMVPGSTGRDTGKDMVPHNVTPAVMSWQMRVPNLFLVFFHGWTSLLLSPTVTLLPTAGNIAEGKIMGFCV